ncbi:MAG: hypothetical protein DHS20C05_25540 [Hyphococcus sp.]|nr:MAG: hypothetical protein DHS20C05_25540 [Marinicaulis sp.]
MIAARPDAWIIGIGTPNGQRGFFYETWATDNDWRKIKVRADQCSRISAETLAEQRRIHGPVKFSQEFECEFLSEGGWLICPSLIAECSQPGKYENVFGKL